MLSKRDPPQNKGHIQTKWRAGKRYSMQMETKRKQEWNFDIRENRLWNKGYEKRQRRTLHNDERINPKDITILNIYALNIRVPQYVKQMLTSMKGKINSNTIIVGDFNTPLTPMDRSTKQKINKETQTLNDIMDQLDLIDIYRIYHPHTMNFTFFSSAYGNFSWIDHILGHKSSLGKFKKN